MKAISVADPRNNFAEISALLPAIKRKDSKLEWPDRGDWRLRVFSKKSADKALASVTDYDRGET